MSDLSIEDQFVIDAQRNTCEYLIDKYDLKKGWFSKEKINQSKAKIIADKIYEKMLNATDKSEKDKMKRALSFLKDECECTTCPDLVPKTSLTPSDPQKNPFTANEAQIKLTEDVNTQMEYLVSLSDTELNDFKN